MGPPPGTGPKLPVGPLSPGSSLGLSTCCSAAPGAGPWGRTGLPKMGREQGWVQGMLGVAQCLPKGPRAQAKVARDGQGPRTPRPGHTHKHTHTHTGSAHFWSHHLATNGRPPAPHGHQIVSEGSVHAQQGQESRDRCLASCPAVLTKRHQGRAILPTRNHRGTVLPSALSFSLLFWFGGHTGLRSDFRHT